MFFYYNKLNNMNSYSKSSKSSKSSSKNSSVSNSEDDDEDYELFCKNVSNNLAKQLMINNAICLEPKNKWDPPKEHGLHNSFNIIPKDYIKNSKNYLLQDLNFFNVIKNDISNFRELNNYELDYFQTLNKNELIELLYLYNNCFSLLNESVIN